MTAAAIAAAAVPAWPASRVAVVVGLSMAVHAAVLLGPLALPVVASVPPPPPAAAVPVTVRVVQAEPLPVGAGTVRTDPGAEPPLPATVLAPPPSPPTATVDAVPIPVPAPSPAPAPAPVSRVADEPAPAPRTAPADPRPAGAPPAVPATTASPAPPAPPAPSGPKAAAGETALPPAPEFHLAAALDPGPKPLGDIDLVFPPEAGLHDGLVALRLLVDETGALVQVAVVRSQPRGMFDAAAIAAFSGARFSPGRLAGVPVKSQLTVEVEFKPYDRGANVSGRSY